MQPEDIVKDYIKAWLISDVIKPADNETLLSAMIDEGKVLYALSILLPGEDADNLIGYTFQQSAWCKNNEKDIWQKIVKKITFILPTTCLSLVSLMMPLLQP